MKIKSILWHFAVYCILRGNSETTPEIAYEMYNLEREVLLLPLNNVPVKTNKTEKFVLMKGNEARIAVYGKSLYTIKEISVYIISERSQLNTGHIICARENRYKCYVKIHQINSTMGGYWDITFKFNGYKDISKTITVHIRSSQVPYIFSPSNGNIKPITTQIAPYSIKDFDAFGCLVYNDQQVLEMKCRNSTSNTNLIEWSSSFVDEQPKSVSGKERAYYKIRLKAEHDGHYLDCIKHMMNKESIIVRIFLRLLTLESWPKDNSVKLITSYTDPGVCLKHVRCLYDPEVQTQKYYCVKPTNTKPDAAIEINFEIKMVQNTFNVISVNGKNDKSSDLETFTIFEEEPANINIYHNSTDITVEKVTISDANTKQKMSGKIIKEEIDNSYTIQLQNIHSHMPRVWTSQIITHSLTDTNVIPYIKSIRVHIRPKEDGMPRVHSREKIIPIQRADSSFQDFDGFGCLLFDGYSNLELFCKKSSGFSTGINWNSGAQINPNNDCSNSEYCGIYLNLPEKGDIYIDCTEQLPEDTTTVRLFLINIKKETTTNGEHYTNDINTPSSEKDRAGCLNYATGYLSPSDSNRESKMLPNFSKRAKTKPLKTNVSNSPPSQHRPSGIPTSPNHIRPRPPPKAPFKTNIKDDKHFRPNSNKPSNVNTDLDKKNKNGNVSKPKQPVTIPSITENSPIANSTLSTTTVFHDFNNKTAWPDLVPTANPVSKAANETEVAGTTSPIIPDVKSDTPFDYYKTVIGVIFTIMVVIILVLTILYVKGKSKKYWTSNKTTESRYANDQCEFNNDHELLRENVENNIYVDSDAGTVQYSNNIADVYANPIPKSERNIQVNNEQAKTKVLVDNSVYEGSNIYAEPNYSVIGKQSNTGTPCNEEYSYVYADRICIRPLVNNTCDKNDEYATINKKGEVKHNADYSNINITSTDGNGTTKDYVNSTSDVNTDKCNNLNNTKQNENVVNYVNASNTYYANPTEM